MPRTQHHRPPARVGLGTQIGTNGNRIYAWSELLEEHRLRSARMGYLDCCNPRTALTIVHGPIPIPAESHIMSIIDAA